MMNKLSEGSLNHWVILLRQQALEIAAVIFCQRSGIITATSPRIA